MTTGQLAISQKKNGQWDTKTKYRAQKKSRKRILREKREASRKRRKRIRILRHGISSRFIQARRAAAKLKIEMAKANPIDSRIWNLAYCAFAEANEILKSHDRMMRLERKKAKARLFLELSRKAEVTLPIEEKKKSEPVMNFCEKCQTIWFADQKENCKCRR